MVSSLLHLLWGWQQGLQGPSLLPPGAAAGGGISVASGGEFCSPSAVLGLSPPARSGLALLDFLWGVLESEVRCVYGGGPRSPTMYIPTGHGYVLGRDRDRPGRAASVMSFRGLHGGGLVFLVAVALLDFLWGVLKSGVGFVSGGRFRSPTICISTGHGYVLGRDRDRPGPGYFRGDLSRSSRSLSRFPGPRCLVMSF